jgi:hypothetical protein
MRLRLRSLSFRAFRKPNLVLFRHPTNANSIASQHLRDIKSAGVLHFVSELRLPLLGQNIDQDEGRRRNRTAVRTGRFNGATTARAFMSLKKGSGFYLWHGPVPCDFIQGTMAEATGNGRRHSCVHCCERSSIENEAAKQIIAKSSKVGTAPANRCNAPAWQGRQMALRRPSRMSPTHTLSG